MLNRGRILLLHNLGAVRRNVHSMFQSHPKLANSCTGFLTFAAGDMLSQLKLTSSNDNKEEAPERLDLSRSLTIGLLGIFMNGICLHYWYRFLDKFVGSSMKSKVGVFIKVLSDQLVYAPFSILTFFSVACIQESNSIQELQSNIEKKVSASFLTTLLADCTLWPFVNFVNFSFVPISYRPSFVAIAQLLWQTYLSTVSHSAVHDNNININNNRDHDSDNALNVKIETLPSTESKVALVSTSSRQ